MNIVVGLPLGHSKSPLLHNIIYNDIGIKSVMVPIPCVDIKSVIQFIKTQSVELTAVTMPFKESILEYLDCYSEDVRHLKAANTVVQRDGKLYGYNTDIDGIAYAFRDVCLTGKNVLLLGAGGAARAAAYFLQQHAANIFLYNRNVDKASLLAEAFGGQIVSFKGVNALDIDVIINATSVGMHPDIEMSPLQHYMFKSCQIIFDMVYNPINTKLLKQAHICGANTIHGIDMFVCQGLRQVELWTGCIADMYIDRIKQMLLTS